MSKFKVGDKVKHKNDSESKGIITKLKYESPKGINGKEYWWVYLDDAISPSGTSIEFELDNKISVSESNRLIKFRE